MNLWQPTPRGLDCRVLNCSRMMQHNSKKHYLRWCASSFTWNEVKIKIDCDKAHECSVQEASMISPSSSLTWSLCIYCECFFFLSIYGFSPISAWSLAAVPVWQRLWWESKITNLQNEFSRCITPFSSISAGPRVLGEKWTVRVVTRSLFDRFLELLFLGWRDPVYAPGAPPVTHCNLWCWEITGAGRPGRHSQLGGAPPVRWGHSQPRSDTLIFLPKMCFFHSFSKASHACIRHCFAAQRPFKSTRIGEQVCTWGRWTEHPDRCVLHTICSTWLEKHLPSTA